MKNKSSKKGFSLIEVLVAMSIFSLIIISFVSSFAGSYFTFRSSKAIQRNLEQSQNAMNLIAKNLRTSTLVSCDSGSCSSSGERYSSIRVFDYSQMKCIDYRFNGNSANGYVVEQASVSTSFEDCETVSAGSYSNMISSSQNHISFGGFYALPSVSPDPSTSTLGSVGRITISFEVCSGTDAGCSTKVTGKAKIQSTVSLRDYTFSGIQ
jgi:prepilin-type N-terminal cleavage/methylation domain-containing protein